MKAFVWPAMFMDGGGGGGGRRGVNNIFMESYQ